MAYNPFLSTIILFGLMQMQLQCAEVVTDTKEERVREGYRFLSASRLDEWEKYFSEGVPDLGKIVTRLDEKLRSECWIERGHFQIKLYHRPGEVLINIGNPRYSASIVESKGIYRILGVADPIDAIQYIPIEAIPFASQSSVCNTRQLIPHFLRAKKLVISDYRQEGPKHHVELAFPDEKDRRTIELVFSDQNRSPLPIETIFNADGKVHLLQYDFTEVNGYTIPATMKVKESRISGELKTTVDPQDRLDHKLCFLSHYGLPEPNDVKVTDFGRSRSVPIVGIVLAIGALVCLYFLTRNAVRRAY